ncbi:unnamed protein product [Gongylonema pulchrum]|uniref:Uncharacterized protein n=1 Tax=Gongylonema pulchrum TaxID=637853 RepID=A0A183CZI0_9BILA|nr:unnamed protein product [Gongylonema pulchrum]
MSVFVPPALTTDLEERRPSRMYRRATKRKYSISHTVSHVKSVHGTVAAGEFSDYNKRFLLWYFNDSQ